MTGANVFHWTAAKAGQAVNTNAAGTKTKTEDSAIAGMFAFMMSANSTEIPVPTETQEPSGNVGISAPVDAYDRYQYRDTGISRADTQGVGEKITESKEELGDFKEQVIAEVAEELDVSEEEVLNAMELLGMTAYDLMNPVNLTQLAVELTGAENPSELLMNPDFVDLMKSVRELGDQLMTAMELPADQKDELIAHMDVLEQPEAMTEMPVLLKQPEEPKMPQTQETTAIEQQGQPEPQMQVEVQVTVEQPAETVLQNQVAVAETENVTEAENEAVTVTETVALTENEAVTEEEAVPEIKAETGDAAAVQKEQPETAQVQTVVQAVEEQPEELPVEPLKEQPAAQPAERVEAETETEEDEAPEQRQPEAVRPEQTQTADGKETRDGFFGDDTRRQSEGFKSFKSFEGAANAVSVNAQDFKAVAMDMPVKDVSFTSIDTIDIIKQIVEQVKVDISGETTTMEMQLNPENLGKVYLQVSAREGSVNAQITAANEAVRNALEIQIADLKQNLNQAGVKVDAIEVTVASHEYEQNLEQNARREAQEGEQAEAVLRRRNIRLDELDEIAGVMTEEETLVAQIMRENGNTIDLSA